jgi:hypothetical protein
VVAELLFIASVGMTTRSRVGERIGSLFGRPKMDASKEAKRDSNDAEKLKSVETHTSAIAGEIDLAGSHQLERGLKSRHIQFLALGGAIGTYVTKKVS